jgi:membrane protease YdiL (CAAX protease family)/uncharacterized RDD family membrane protein YckC
MSEYTGMNQEGDEIESETLVGNRNQLASISQRAAAQMIDFMFLTIVFVLATYYAKGVWLMMPGDHLWIIFDPICGVFLISIFAYFIGMEGLFGFTLGKLITGLRVVGEQGTRISMKQSAKRNLCRFIDGIAVYVVGIRIARKSPLIQRYGDKIGQTIVVLHDRNRGGQIKEIFVNRRGGDMRAPKEADYKTMALFFFVSLVIVLLYLEAYQIGMIQSVEVFSGGLIHRTLILNAFLILIAVYGVLILRGKFQWEDFGLDTRKMPTALVIGLATWLLIQFIEGILGYIHTGVTEIDYRWNTDSLGLIGLLIGMLFGTALYEEVGYRGFLLVQLGMKMESTTENKYAQIILALLISQFLFTLLHIPWIVLNQGWTISVLVDLIFSVFLNGVIYCLLYLRTENIFFVIIVHALGNAPTSLISPFLEPSNILLVLAIIWAAVWPSLLRWEETNDSLTF